ncbi:MAG: hypothetical protein AAFY57_02850 [Cyanobacteria bacterium J06642_2]
MPDVALVTCSHLPELPDDDGYLQRALARREIDAQPIIWDDLAQDWSQFRLSVLRSPWDYSLRYSEFLAWLDRVSSKTHLWNGADVVRWNTHKRYLKELRDREIATVPTHWLAAGTQVNLQGLMCDRGWSEVVVKPAVSANSRKTVRCDRPEIGQAHLNTFLPHLDMMVQPYLPSIETTGELSLIFIDSKFAHAVRKCPAIGDYRIQEDYGGQFQFVVPTAAELTLAERTLAKIPFTLLYARVDLVRSWDDEPLLIELELVEPSLYFAAAPGTAEILAEVIARLLAARS